MSSPRRPAFAFLLCLIFLACAPPPPAPAVATVAPPPIAAAAGPDLAVARDAGETFVEEGDPGPVPVHARDPWWGRLDAPVTIVEFADFQCPFCTRANATLTELRRIYGPEKLRIVWKNMPLPFHPKATPAALVAMKIHERFGNEAFWRTHDAFFADQAHLDREISDEAARLGLDAGDLDMMAKGPERARLDGYADEAKHIGATGTPAFFINGVHLSGAQPIDKFTAIIDEQLRKAQDLAARGTPRRRVYAELAKAQWQKPEPPASKRDDQDDTVVWQVPLGKSPVRGKATALVTVVEFADFQCPFCGRVAPTLDQLQQKYGDQIRFVFKQNPLPFHPNAAPAAELALEARAQKGDAGFWKAHDLLLGKECRGNAQATNRADCEASGALWVDHQQQLDTQGLLAAATTLGLDLQRVNAALVGNTHAAEIIADQDLADDIQANGTPHFFINGRRLVGAQPFEKFAAVVDEELAKAQALVKGGVKPAQVYERISATGKTPPPPEKRVVPAPTRDNPSRGPENAKVVVQFFSDFQCPFCARVRPTLEELEKAFPGKIRVVWRNMPLPMHPQAELAAEAAMEAFQQKGAAGFWAMYELLYAAPAQNGGLDRPALERYASQLGLDPIRFADALDARAHRAVIEADAKVAADAGISGTPAFVINGYFVSGAQPLAKFKKVVALALAAK